MILNVNWPYVRLNSPGPRGVEFLGQARAYYASYSKKRRHILNEPWRRNGVIEMRTLATGGWNEKDIIALRDLA